MNKSIFCCKNYRHLICKLFTILSLVMFFSCSNELSYVVKYENKTLPIPTCDTVDSKLEYGKVIRFSYSPNDANLVYTLDGTEPEWGDSNFYNPNEGIKLTESCTLKARLYHSNYNPSPVLEKRFSIYIEKPVISPDKNEITTAEGISITHNLFGTKIYYTIDGNTPTEDMEEYDGKPFTLPAGIQTVKVLAIKDGVKSTIEKTFTVIDAEAAYLDSLSVNDGTNEYINNFSKTEYGYEINLPNTVEKVTVKAASDSCTVENGDEVISLEKGETKTLMILVISKDNPSKSNIYNLTIYRASDIASNDARLLDLKLTDNNGVTLPLPFTMDTESYSLDVPYETNCVTVTFQTSHNKAKADVVSGKVYTLNEGKNVFTVKVTAEDGVTTKLYSIEITRDISPPIIIGLKSLNVAGTFVNVSEYMTFSSVDSTVRVIATAENESAIVKINGQAVTGIDVAVPSTVTIEVADRVATKSYVLDIKKVSSAALTSLTVNGKNVSVNTMMSFVSETETAEITATVNEETASFTIDGVAATSGVASSVVISADGKTATKAIKIALTSKDGAVVNYELSVNYNEVITDKIIIHAYDYVNVYTYETSDSLNKKHTTLVQEGSSSWYTATLEVTSAKVIFTKSAGGWNSQYPGSNQPGLDVNAGEWWFKDGKWYDYNPEDSQSPVVQWVAPADGDTLSDVETLTVNATDDVGIAKIEFYCDSKLIGTITSGMTYSWDSANVANGSHKLKAIAYDKSGNKAESAEISVTTTNANKAPVAVISSVGAIFEGVEKTFSGAESTDNGTIVSYAWDFGDGSTGSGVTATHTYKSAGTYTVTLTTTDDGGLTKSTILTVTVNKKDDFVHRDFREENVYFMMTDRFADGDKTNNNIWGDEYLPKGESQMYDYSEDKTGILTYYHGGDFKGIINNLDYLVEMGFTAIWITPSVKQPEGRYFYDGSGGGDAYQASAFHGYWGYDFDKIDPHLHSSGKNSDGWADFTAFVDACHAKGIRVMQDIVINHGNHTAATVPTKWANNKVQTILDGKEWAWATLDPYHEPVGAGQTPSKNGFYAYYGFGQCADLIDFGHLGEDGKDSRHHLINVYKKFIDAGVDAFRIDTMAYIPNEFAGEFADAMYNHAKSLGNDHFYMIGEAWCGRYDAVARHSLDKTDSLHMLDMHLSCLDYPGQMSSVFRGDSYARFEDVIAGDAGWGTDAEEHTKTAMFVDNHDCFRNNGIFTETQYKNALNYIYLFRGVPVVYYGTEAMYSWSGAHASTNKDDIVSRWMLGDKGINYVKQNKPTMYKHLKVLNTIRSASPCIQKGVQKNIVMAGDQAVFTRTYEGKVAYVAISKGAAFSHTFSDVKSGSYTLYSSASDGNYTATDVTVSGSYSVNVPANGFAFIEPK